MQKLQRNMPVHTKHAFPLKMFNLMQSKNSTFHLFIFLIGLSLGFYCAFYLENFSTVLQTSIFSVLHALSSSQRLVTPNLPPPDSWPPLPSPNPSLTLPTQPISSALILSPSPQPSLSLPSDISPFLSLSPQPSQPPPPPPSSSNSINFITSPPLLILSPTRTPSLSLPSSDTLELSPTPAPSPSPSPSPLLSDSINSTTPPSLLQLSTSPPLESLSSRDSPTSSSSYSPQLAPAPAPTPTPSLLSESINSTTKPSLMLANVSLSEQIPLVHNMSDEDLVKSAMKIATMSVHNTTPYKVAFMFLTSGPLPLSPLWELFFKGHESLFSIYIHPHPSYNDTFPKDSIFYGRRITSQPVYWGDISMVDAERRLLANALLDPSNQRFVLLSESCIPLFNFTTTYNYLINSNLSFINSFDDPRKSGRGRYNPQMSPNITVQEWRKGSQWFEVNRDLALGIIVEQNYYNIFKEYCHPACYNDEHYLPTMVNILYPKMNSNRSITYVDWSISGPHPRKFSRNHITEDFLNSIRFGSTECVYNNNMTPMCVLFARKFAPNTLMPLLEFAPMLFGFNP